MSRQELAGNNNQVPPGYKQTEVGVIPEDWEVVLLDSVAKRGSGHTPDKKHPEYWNGNIKWISLKDSDRLDVPYIDDTADKTTPLGIANSSAVVHPAGTVILSRDAGVGKSAIMRNEMAVSQHFMTWQCSTQLENHFLYYWLQVRKPEFERIAIGSTIKTIGLPYFKHLKIPLPPLPEQKAIASVLSDVDELISSLDKLIAKKRHIKTATMQQLLTGKTRLPGFGEGMGYKKSAIGLIPEDWEVKQLKDVIQNFQNGYAFSAQGYVDYGIPIITMSQIGIDGTFQFREECINYWPCIHGNKLQSYKVKNGDIIISMTDVTPEKNLIGRMTIVDLEPEQTALLNQRVGLLRLDINKVNSIFITAFSHQRQWRGYCVSVASLGVQANMGTKEIKDGILLLPTLPEQKAIASVLSDMDKEIAALEKRRAKTQGIKQGMMQELLTGRTRLINNYNGE